MKMANMNRRDIRAMFPNQMVSIDNAGVDLLDRVTGERIASTVYAAYSGAVVFLYNRKKVFGKPDHQTVAHVKTYETEQDHTEAANAERRQVGRPALSDRTLKNEWNRIQESDFKDALEIMREFIFLLAGNTGGGCTNHQFKQLTTIGKRLNTRLQNENNDRHDEARKAHKVHRANETVDDRMARQDARAEAPNTPHASQLSQVYAEAKALSEERDKRIVWGAEDDELFDLLTREHKALSDRLAMAHAARGSKISIPEWERRKNAKEKV